MPRFPKNDILSLIGEKPRYDLGESVGPDLHLGDLLDASGPPNLGDMALSYGTAEGDSRLRKAIADSHRVGSDDVVVTVGGMHALFLIAFILCDPGDEAVTSSPVFPLTRNALEDDSGRRCLDGGQVSGSLSVGRRDLSRSRLWRRRGELQRCWPEPA